MHLKKQENTSPQLASTEESSAYSKMLISREKGRTKLVNTKKVSQGSFYTEGDTWLTKPVVSFISMVSTHTKTVLDPFAGDGHILKALKERFQIHTIGMDIDGDRWDKNDSLMNIPKLPDVFICTNPPYLAKHSAARKGVLDRVKQYFGTFNDLYQVALASCFKAARYTVALIPETFLNSAFPFEHLKLVSVIEDNPFGDTDQPVLVAAFDSSYFDGSGNSDIYIGDSYCFKMRELQKFKIAPSWITRIIFNYPTGRIALKAVDGTRPGDKIHFVNAKGFSYSRENVKVSSRLLTYIEMPDIADNAIDRLLKNANQRLLEIRSATKDLILSPFKGNNKEGKRRRRLDYKLARYILESSFKETSSGNNIMRPLFE